MKILTGSLLFICLGLLPLQSACQYLDAGIGFGASWYRGDLYHGNSESFFNVHGAAAAFGHYNFNDILSARASFTYGKISGDDAHAEDEMLRQRNLLFRSNIFEAGLRVEANVPGFDPYNYRKPISPYFFAGVSWFSFNPETFYQDEWVELQPLGTEGQGIDGYDEPYKLSQISFPIGAGIKYALTDLITLGLDFGIRITATDYLDDVSGSYVPYSVLSEGNGELAAALGNRTGEYLGTGPSEEDGPRGNPSDNDSYGTLMITVAYNFLDNGFKGSRMRGNRSKRGCPTN